ncbi:hypothetical protein [Streptomyces tendae]|uniref:hypothetical protein n=1 Tax=Streptomyces tendae TaxID=1932 RepID=UPI003EBBCAA1
MTDQPEKTMVAIDGSDALAFVIIRPGSAPGTVSAEAVAQGISKHAAAHVLQGIVTKWNADTASCVRISADVAAHVLWTENRGGYEPGSFTKKLLAAWPWADDANAARLTAGWPAYAAAFRLLGQRDGLEQLRAIAGDHRTETAACAKCKTPFDPDDTSFDGRGQHYRTPYCRRCVDRCHESTDASHACVICR